MTRDDSIYITPELKRWLYQLRKLDKFRDSGKTAEFGFKKIVTIEDIAERLLTEKILHDFPNIKALNKRLDALEGQLIVELENGEKHAKSED